MRRWLLFLAVMGCAAPVTEGARSSHLGSPDLPASKQSPLNEKYDFYGVLKDTPYSARLSSFETATVAAPLDSSSGPSRPARVGKRDIRLHHARLDNALRLLAREGNFNLVIQGALAGLISIELSKVEPWDALLAIAEARGLDISFSNNIAIVH